MPDQKPFEELTLPRKAFYSEKIQYCVYAQDGSVKEVMADTIQEAITQSGVENPVKIERFLLSTTNILDASVLAEDVDVDKNAVPEVDTAVIPETDQPASQQPAV